MKSNSIQILASKNKCMIGVFVPVEQLEELEALEFGTSCLISHRLTKQEALKLHRGLSDFLAKERIK